jgi:hypothetical protein
MGDGVSLPPQTRTKPLVLPIELTPLRDGEASLKLPGAFAPGKIQLTLKQRAKGTEAFQEA